jgi:hypothetical protein
MSVVYQKERGGLYPARPRRLQPPCWSKKICGFLQLGDQFVWLTPTDTEKPLSETLAEA